MKTPKHYLFLVSLSYAIPVLRPLQNAIRKRGDTVAWFVDEPETEKLLEVDEIQIVDPVEVIKYNPVAVFTCGNYMYDFFPGVKVQLFHGYPINKRNDIVDDHFSIRGWFDMYCTQGASSTEPFKRLEAKHNFFRVYETGWPKADTYFAAEMQIKPQNKRPVVLYSTTFTKNITSIYALTQSIKDMVERNDWDWIFMFHPKLDDPIILDFYKTMAAQYDNVTYLGTKFDIRAMQRADVMLCDNSSIILEFMFLGKPVVTFKNSQPSDYLLNIEKPSLVHGALEHALTYPENLMNAISKHTLYHEPHRDCKCSERVLDAVDAFLADDHKNLRTKPLNLLRRWKVRRKLRFYPLLAKLRRKLQ